MSMKVNEDGKFFGRVVAAFAGAVPVLFFGGILWWADARTADQKAKVVGNDWKAAEGVVDFIGEDGERITVPIAALPTLAGQARRVMNAHENKIPPVGGHRLVFPLRVDTVQVGTMPQEGGPQIVLTLDGGTDVETLLALPIRYVRDIAAELVKAADEADGQSLTRQ